MGNFPEAGDHMIQGVPEGRQGQAQGRGTFPLGTWGWHGQGAVMAAVPPTADRRGGTDRQPAATLLRQHRQAAAQEVTRLQHSLSIPGPRPAANVWGEYSSIQPSHPCSLLRAVLWHHRDLGTVTSQGSVLPSSCVWSGE